MAIKASRLGRWGRIGGLAAALLCAGCATSDLSKNSKITDSVVECLPPDTPAPIVVARAVWYPKARGFGTTDASPLGHATGVLVLAGDKLWFMAWDNSELHYDMLHSVPILRAAKIRVDHLGPSAMLVVEAADLSYDAFELMEAGAFSSDPKATEALYQKLQGLRAQDAAKHPSEPLFGAPR
jgi:hypothetical protein